ncbi:unnamed protein product [Moneuplotes crassus]|uniref:Uncharacterized protein n=1 Tax=Euplotes crassus TaxID=5936 RepID=A0AAD1XZ14_EUPCR|nr:unnamed protein product [Moneuplotes crassus]
MVNINLNVLSKVLNVSLSVTSFALGIIRMIFPSFFDASDLMNYILSAYFIIFGIFLFIASVYITLLINWFGFFETYFGRGLFHFFMASLAFSGWANWAMIIIGSVFILAGVVHMILSVTVSGSPYSSTMDSKNEGMI